MRHGQVRRTTDEPRSPVMSSAGRQGHEDEEVDEAAKTNVKSSAGPAMGLPKFLVDGKGKEALG